jgi:molecular chaperone GrpE (heat shock protein)
MRLCDLLWIAQASGTALEAQAVTELVKELRAVLAYEGVTTLNATGLLDPMRQRVVGTQPTAAPQQHNQIAQTVRPGYQCGDHLLRPQDVIIARLAKPNPPEVHAT